MTSLAEARAALRGTPRDVGKAARRRTHHIEQALAVGDPVLALNIAAGMSDEGLVEIRARYRSVLAVFEAEVERRGIK